MSNFYFENHPLEFYANLCDMSLSSFKQTFSSIMKNPPLAYLTSIKLDRAKYYLCSTNMTIKEVAESVGYDNPLYFSRIFKKYFGVSPSKFIEDN